MGITLFENQNAPKQISTINTINERIILNNETPADFIANNSNFSPISPNDINDANNIANGNANGTNDNHEYNKNSNNTLIGNPLPTISPIYNHKNCIIKMNEQIKNVAKNSNKKFFKTYISIRFIYSSKFSNTRHKI
jgi:hypothetical protein